MTTCFISLGKVGDIISSLPILHHEFVTTKRKPVVLTSAQYVHLFDRVPFVEVQIHTGSWMDLSGAMRWARKNFDRVVSLAVFGKDFPMQHRTSSYQLEAYERAGYLKWWDRLQLTGLAKSDPVSMKNPAILLADHSESSPFLQNEDLFKLLKDSFPGHEIVRLSMHRLPHFFDFLSWYDAADALVSIDTSHLHLSAATRKPVVALVQDRPDRWHGSAWSKRFACYCRYSEFDGRKDELVECLRDAITKKPKPEMVEMN